jgi:hypothetical protein
MKIKFTIILSFMFILFTVGIAGAQQMLMPGATIQKFVEPLAVAGDLSVINATSAGLNEATFPVNAEEFQSQILPANTCQDEEGNDASASWVWGYLTDGDDKNVVRPSFLGPVIVAETGVAANPTYGNNLPVNGNVQQNLPIDMTLDWADPMGIDCHPIQLPVTGPPQIVAI